jgi:hypothetical protein
MAAPIDPTAPISSLLDAPEIDLPPGYMNMVRIYRLLPGQHWGEIVPVAVLPPPPTDAELLAEARAEIERLKAERSELMAARDAAFAALRVRNIHGAGAVELSAAPTHRPAQGWVPRDGHQWFEHTPGDPCPVAGDVEVEVVAYHQRQTLSWKPRAFLARRWDWSSIVAWRPA